jgi:lipid-A-disaccharide synthase
MLSLGDNFRFVIPVASTLSEKTVVRAVDNAARSALGLERLGPRLERDTPGPVLPIHWYSNDAREALRHARAALVASGTATVEAALIGTPMVVVYRLSGLTWRLGRRLVKLEHFAMPNLIAGRRIVPELIQHDLTAENAIRELNKIIPDGPERERMIAGLAEVRAKLTSTSVPPAERAARVVLEVAARH